MDDITLEGLKAAYTASPSPQLAKIILLALISREEYTELDIYLAEDDLGLSYDEAVQGMNALNTSATSQLLVSFLRHVASADVVRFIRGLVDGDEKEKAAELYQAMIENTPDFRSDELSALTGVAEQADTQASNSKSNTDQKVTKLRLVEKVDMADVTDLTRYVQATTTFADVVGLDEIKKQINKKIILPFQKPSLFQRFKKRIGGGVLLYGPPGCGKTLLARATAGECGAAFFNIEISDVLDMYIGESEQKLHAIFEKARASTPSVLFFDELEALAGKREHTRNSSSSNVISQFLTELDGFSQNNSGVLVLASTNVPWSIDPAFLRPGRFDRMFFVPPPDKTARASILQHHMKERPRDNSIDYTTLAAKCSGYSGADLANLVEMAADEAIDESIVAGSDVDIQLSHFKEALQDSRATTTEWLTTARNYARYANDGGRYDDVLAFLKKHGK
ncbi:ATP-binding protein [Agarilytica rhodophyticola]|uniref:ATP-binding protein n=1 Tax=Agarilytica rhodophyticola TaxID=1737490 RepID=UPI000B3471E2|nr:ATP-binding protein [Agarilytica rhodophyticola]